MKILFTGASSFTGYWFVRQLHQAGHEVTATFRQSMASYAGIRGRRVAGLANCCQPRWGIGFGDDAFVQLIQQDRFELLCHHAADVTNYKSPDFNAIEALANNTRNLPAVLHAFAAAGGRAVVLTGSIFENGEGAGSDGLPAFSPYGLSKAMTAQTFEFHSRQAKITLGKFVVPNPFGPMEEPRFTAYLINHWLAGKTPSVQTPEYVRDNIHVSLLAQSYARFAACLPAATVFAKCNPSGYIESQGAFAQRVAREMRPRLGVDCPLDLQQQKVFAEPRIRINTDPVDTAGWSEPEAWGELAAFYRPQ